tara:strand:- start:5185 stop:6198 length:1014 start_codon:yes stop_codon:yes gene_type:complete
MNMTINDDGTILGILLFINNLLPFLLFILGCGILYFSSEFFIENSIAVSQKLNISPIIIGASVVAIGTSFPELLVSLYSIFTYDNPNDLENLVSSSLVIGNILGSNMANISLVLGFCAFLYKISFNLDIIKDLLFITLLGLYLLFCIYFELEINYLHGILLLISFVIYFFHLIKTHSGVENELDDISNSLKYSFFIIGISMIGLSIGTNLIVDNALNISKIIGVSELNIGFSIVALGTSLPELFTSLSSIKRGKHSLLVGNVIGSNILNIIFVLGVSSLFTNLSIKFEMLHGGYFIGIIFIATHIFLILNYIFYKSLSKISGLILLVAYTYFIFKLF